MLNLLSPAALWALGTLALPVALHLWRQPPRTVRWGSLRFLRARAEARWRDLRWRERSLLALRLALFALLALALARPVWRSRPARTPQRWALLDPAATLDGSSLARWRALSAAGYAPHRLAEGLPTLTAPAPLPAENPVDLWSLVREADATLPPGSSLAVFSPARAAELRGIRPVLRSRVEWVATREAFRSPAAWLQSARPSSPGGEPRLTVGMSDADRLNFVHVPPPGWKAETVKGNVRLTGPDARRAPEVPIRPLARPSILILHDAPHAEDARFLAAAVEAALSTEAPPFKPRVAIITPGLPAQPDTDWTFWLSSSGPPEAIKNRRTILWQDTPGMGTAVNDRIVPQPGTRGAEFLTPSVRLWRRAAPPAIGPVEWTDGQGVPLLTRTETVHGPRWYFAGRFHPDWTDFPRTSAFPTLLRAWLRSQPVVDPFHDLRQAAVEQARPETKFGSSKEAASLPGRSEDIDLYRVLCVLAVGCFAVERVLSHWVDRQKAPSVPPFPNEVFAERFSFGQGSGTRQGAAGGGSSLGSLRSLRRTEKAKRLSPD